MRRTARPAHPPARHATRHADREGHCPADGATASGEAGGRIRIDRWLCHARIFRTRSLAATRVAGGGVRVNGNACLKPAQSVGPGDVVTVAAHGQVQVLRVLAVGTRRGPPAEAQLLYDRLDSPEDADGADIGPPAPAGQ